MNSGSAISTERNRSGPWLGRPWYKRLVAAILLGILMIVFFRWFEYHQVYQPYRRLDFGPLTVSAQGEDVMFSAADGVRLNAWFLPARTNATATGRVVLLSHGNGGNITHRVEIYQILLRLGLHVFAYDYRGYGRSEGRPSEWGTYRDLEAAYAWLKARGFQPDQILLMGESLGGAVAADLATRVPAGGLILQSTFTSIPDIGAELFPFLPVRWLSTIRYDTRSKLPQIRMPLVILHSRADTLVRFHHAERNFAAANDPKQLIEIAGDHNDGPGADEARYVAAWKTILAPLAVLIPPTPSVSP